MVAVSGRAAAVPPDTQAANADPFDALVREAQAELAEGVQRAGLARDPYRHLMAALSHALGLFPALVQRLDQVERHGGGPIDPELRAVASDIKQQLSATLEAARQPADPAVVDRLEKAAVRGADRRSAELARAHNLRTLLTYGGAFVAAVVASAIGGAVWDHSNQVATIRSTEAGVSAAFRDGPAAAASWLNLMNWNDPAQALAACTGINLKVIEGRRACGLPLWIDPPTQKAPH